MHLEAEHGSPSFPSALHLHHDGQSQTPRRQLSHDSRKTAKRLVKQRLAAA